MTSGFSVIDVALCCNWRSRDELYSYLPRSWQDYVPPRTRVAGVRSPWTNPEGDYVPSSRRAEDGPPGSSVNHVVEDGLGPHVERAILLMDEGGALPAVNATYLAHELVRAANAWLIDTWLSGQDSRLYGLVIAPAQRPDAAAREIKRWAGHERIVGVHLRANALGKPFGHPVYHPIYAAAAKLDLPIVIEAGGDVLTDSLTHPTAGGVPMTFGEYAALQGSAIVTHIVNMIAQGVFRKYSDLKVMLIGAGVAWLPWLLWRADAEWKNIRREIPWVDVPPSEYFRDRIRVATVPLERGDGTFKLGQLLGAIDGIEDICCFASNYPRWNAETPTNVMEAFPSEWHRRVLYDNARDFFRWNRNEDG